MIVYFCQIFSQNHETIYQNKKNASVIKVIYFKGRTDHAKRKTVYIICCITRNPSLNKFSSRESCLNTSILIDKLQLQRRLKPEKRKRLYDVWYLNKQTIRELFVFAPLGTFACSQELYCQILVHRQMFSYINVIFTKL